MYYKKIFLLLLILPILLLSVTGCTSSQENGPTQPENNDIPAPPHEKPSSMPSPSITVELSFPDGAPSLNQTRELLCTVSTPGMRTDTGISIDIQLPDAFQLVSGELSWSGMVPGKSSIGVINPNLRSTTTGNWTINVSYQITPKPGEKKAPDTVTFMLLSRKIRQNGENILPGRKGRRQCQNQRQAHRY